MSPLAWLNARRAARNAEPFTADEWAMLRDAIPEGKALRRRRRKSRPALIKGAGL